LFSAGFNATIIINRYQTPGTQISLIGGAFMPRGRRAAQNVNQILYITKNGRLVSGFFFDVRNNVFVTTSKISFF